MLNNNKSKDEVATTKKKSKFNLNFTFLCHKLLISVDFCCYTILLWNFAPKKKFFMACAFLLFCFCCLNLCLENIITCFLFLFSFAYSNICVLGKRILTGGAKLKFLNILKHSKILPCNQICLLYKGKACVFVFVLFLC